MARKGITAKNAKAVGPYSHGIDCDGLIFLSGQTPLDPKTGKMVSGGIKEQTEQVFQNLSSVLEAADLTFENVVKANVYLADMNDFAAMNEVYKNKFSEPFPARTTIGVCALPLGAQVEIEMIAKKL